MPNLPSLKVHRRSLDRRAADVLREEILSRRFPPGFRLVETWLAQQLHVSRGTVRAALLSGLPRANALFLTKLGDLRPDRGRLTLILEDLFGQDDGGRIALVRPDGYLGYLAWPTIALGWTLASVRRGLAGRQSTPSFAAAPSARGRASAARRDSAARPCSLNTSAAASRILSLVRSDFFSRGPAWTTIGL